MQELVKAFGAQDVIPSAGEGPGVRVEGLRDVSLYREVRSLACARDDRQKGLKGTVLNLSWYAPSRM
jgi:hypothetical protein